MTLAGSKRNSFGVTLSASAASALRNAAKDLDMPPTTLAAQVLERALQERTGLSPETAKRKSAGRAANLDRDPNENLLDAQHIAGALRCLQEEVRALRAGPGDTPQRRASPPARDPNLEVLGAIRSLQSFVAAFRRHQFNASLKLLTTAGHLTADEAKEFARRYLSD